MSPFRIGLALIMSITAGTNTARSQSDPASSKPGEVAFESFRYAGADTVGNDAGPGQFLNPILAGFYPDPSVCRAGDDYYLINSTFAYFPGIPVWHSRDLVNWRQVGNALDRPSQAEALKRAGTGSGVFAATIKHHAGRFYIASTLVGRDGGNFVITADRPEGPWSDPTWFRDVAGIDPSLFFDDDGRTYLVHNGEPPDKKALYDGHRAIYLWEVDLEAGKTLGGPRLLVNGGVDLSKKPIWIEGPHIFRKNGWYYLCAAEGGTGPAHSQVIFRSKGVSGPYEPFAGNPILTQRHLPGDRPNPVTCTGHADLVELPNGDWWAVFLGCRPLDTRHTVLTGRETFLLPVQWHDGWPMILGKDAVLPRVVQRPALTPDAQPAQPPTTGSFVVDDQFDARALAAGWMSFRLPQESWSRLHGGALRLRPRPVRLTSRTESPSFICRRQQHAEYEVETVVSLEGTSGDCDAGLAVFQDERHHYFLGVRSRDGIGTEVFVERTLADRRTRDEVDPEVLKSIPLPPDVCRVMLRAVGKGLTLDFAHRLPNENEWTPIFAGADASILSERVAGGFTGVVVGVHARTNPREEEVK